MATTVLYLDAASAAPSYNGQGLRTGLSPLAGVAPIARPLGATSGVRPGTPSTTVSVSGTTWSCAAHSGIIDAESSANAGPYLYATDGTDTGTVTAADATNPRVDIVYVQVNDQVQDGSGLESGTVGYAAGTPAASNPQPPTTPPRSLVLAQISVPKSGGGNPTVSWVATGWDQPPAWSAARLSAIQSIGSTTETQVVFGTALKNARNIYSVTTGNATIGVPGWYDLTTSIQFDTNANNNGYVAIEVNGTKVAGNSTTALAVSATAAMRQVTVSTKQYLNIGDVVGVYVWHNASSAINVNPNSGPVSFAGVYRGS
jgi:hypothetical protein